MAINILVFDDEQKKTQRLLNFLKKKTGDNIDNILVESNLEIENLEHFSFDLIPFAIDVVMIDYQLNCKFTGVTLSALMLNQKYKVPRISLSSALVDDANFQFEASLLKTEINNNPYKVLEKILITIENFKKNEWIDKEYEKICDEYLKYRETNSNDEYIEKLEELLDKFESATNIKLKESIEKTNELKKELDDEEKNIKCQIEELNLKIDRLLKEIYD